jgi:protein gp37
MSQYTKIEWADSTLNFVSGCTKVSAGCAHCYAEALSKRQLGNIGQWGKGAPRKRHESAFKLAYALNRKPWICDGCGQAFPTNHITHLPTPGAKFCCNAPYHRRRIFSLSLGDWLDDEIPIQWLVDMLDVIRLCDQVQWLLVTKRPELFKPRLTAAIKSITTANSLNAHLWQFILDWVGGKPPPYVMVLTSVEDQAAAELRIPQLLKIPAKRRGLSLEPLLGPVNLRSVFGHEEERQWLDWLIIGGESGVGARPCNVNWIRSLVAQGQSTGVPTFVKQLGANTSVPAPFGPLTKKGGDMAEWPTDLRIRQFPE